MADSENSRTLSPVTRRGLLSGTAVWLTDQIANVLPEPGATVSGGMDEQGLFLWRDWMADHGKVEQLCRVRKRAEGRLVVAAHSPLVKVPEPGGKRPAAAFRAGKVNALHGMSAKTADARIKVKPACRARKPGAMDKTLGDARARTAGVVAQGAGGKPKLTFWAQATLSPTLPRSSIPFSSRMLQGSIVQTTENRRWPWRADHDP